MTLAAEYEADIVRYLTGPYKVAEWASGPWRVRRVDRSLPNRSTFYASRRDDDGGVRVQSVTPSGVARLMARWEAGADA